MSALIGGWCWSRHSDAIAAHCHNGPGFQCFAVASHDIQGQLNSSIGRDVGQSQQPAMRQPFLKDQLAENGVDRHEHSLFAESLFQERPIAGIRSKLSCLDNIMAVLTQSDGQTVSRATVDEKSHVRATSTSSSDS